MDQVQDSEDEAATVGEKKIIVLCGVSGCCPEVEKTADGYEIRDDNQGKVTLTDAQFAALQLAKF